MQHPVKKVFITQDWGVNPDTYARFGYKGHNGTDYRLFDENGNISPQSLIYAPHSGIVKEAALDKNGYGYYVKIENDKEGSILAHLHSIKVNVGERVEEGQLIAVGNNTGWSTGPHLHWGYYQFPRDKNNGYGGTIDQIPILEQQGGNMTHQQFYNKFVESFRKHRDNLDWGPDRDKVESFILQDDAMLGRIFDQFDRERKALKQRIKELEAQPSPGNGNAGSQPEQLPKTYNGKEVTGVIIKP